jgi:hypothetical protein
LATATNSEATHLINPFCILKFVLFCSDVMGTDDCSQYDFDDVFTQREVYVKRIGWCFIYLFCLFVLIPNVEMSSLYVYISDLEGKGKKRRVSAKRKKGWGFGILPFAFELRSSHALCE